MTDAAGERLPGEVKGVLAKNALEHASIGASGNHFFQAPRK
jgi:hypothetical protein